MASGSKTDMDIHSKPIVLLLDNLPIPACLLDSSHTIRFANRSYIEHFGLLREAPCYRHLYDRKVPCLSCPLQTVIRKNRLEIRQENPSDRAFDVHYLPIGTVDDTSMVLQLWQNSTRPRETYTPTFENNPSYEIIDALPEQIAIIDQHGTITTTNRAWDEYARRNIRKPERFFEGGNYLEILDKLAKRGKQQRSDFLLGLREILSGNLEEFSMETSTDSAGEKLWFLSRGTRMTGKDKETYVIITHTPTTELKNAEGEVQKLAYFDNLTGLPNRLLLNDRLLHSLELADRNDESIAVMFLDLDHFKEINDTLGHIMGDELLKSVAKRLVGCTRKSDTVARLGGDEFIILLPNIKHFNDVTTLANKVLHAISHPFNINGREIHSSTSIGISFFPDDANNAELLIRNADIAMYQAKDQGRNAYMFFSREMNERLVKKMDMQKALREAVKQNEFALFYQDQINLQTGRIGGVEALLRWQHPTLGLLTPADFLDIAEETGLIVPIGNWVLKTACEQIISWEHAGFTPIRVSVNLSKKQLYQMNLAEKIKEILIKAGLSPERLLIEVTEESIRKNFERAQQVLSELKQVGVEIAIDSFGSDFSSLSQLQHLVIDRLNIDHPFIREITNNPCDTAIIRSIIATAHNLGLKVMAEGVETATQRDFLKISGCDDIQGYNFLRPLPENEVTDFLRHETQKVEPDPLAERVSLVSPKVNQQE
jgi:diguanylate cyclase (GGDEF)-like protein